MSKSLEGWATSMTDLPAALRPAGLDNPEAVADKGQIRQAGVTRRVQARYVQVAVSRRR